MSIKGGVTYTQLAAAIAAAALDATTKANAATAVANTKIPKDVTANGVGLIAPLFNGPAALAANGTIAGSSLYYPSSNGSGQVTPQAGARPTGTWRNVSGGDIPANVMGLFQQIA